MEMTRRSEEEVCSALNDCDFDVAKACDLLFEEVNTQVIYRSALSSDLRDVPF